jgi:hypothetical protein
MALERLELPTFGLPDLCHQAAAKRHEKRQIETNRDEKKQISGLVAISYGFCDLAAFWVSVSPPSAPLDFLVFGKPELTGSGFPILR